MNIAFYSAAAGMRAFQDKLDVTANNMANINTTGYKKIEASFQDLIYTEMNTKVEGNHKTGHGSRLADMDLVFQQGMLERTDRTLDFAIAGKAYFAVDDGNGDVSYTRDGAFRIGMNQGNAYLTTASGAYVLDGNGGRIQIPVIPGTNTADGDALRQRIGLFTFDNPYGLTPAGGNLYKAGEAAGEVTSVPVSGENRLIPCALEGSMADTSTEMIHVIEAQRALQMNARMVTSADEIEEMINSLR